MKINATVSRISVFLHLSIFPLFCLGLQPALGQSGSQSGEVGIEERLGEFLPADLTFATAQGDSVVLRDLIDKPTILAFIYYDCPGICTPLLNGLVDVLQKLGDRPGQDYDVMTLSINPLDTAASAKQKKKSTLASFRKTFPQEAWHFLTGTPAQIEQATRAVGFLYRQDETDFAHPGLLTVLSPDGQIIRYLFGIQFNQFDLKMALIEALEGRPSPTIAKVLQFCFSYDPEGRSYALNVIKISGTVILLFTLIFVVYLVMTSKSRKTQVEVR